MLYERINIRTLQLIKLPTHKIQCNNTKFILADIRYKTVTMLPRSVFLQSHHAPEKQSELFHWTCTTSAARQTHSDRDKPEAKTHTVGYMHQSYFLVITNTAIMILCNVHSQYNNY